MSFDLTLPIERLALLEVAPPGKSAIRGGRLTWLVMAPQGNRGRPALRRKEIAIEIPAETPPSGLYRLGVSIDLPPGEYLLGMAVRDELGGQASILRREVRIPAPDS